MTWIAIGILFVCSLFFLCKVSVRRGVKMTLTWGKESAENNCLHKAISEFYMSFIKQADDKVKQYLNDNNLSEADWYHNGEKREFRHGNISKIYFYYKKELVVTIETEMTGTGLITRVI